MTRKSAAEPLLAWAREQGCDTAHTADRMRWRITYHGRYVGTVPVTTSDPRAIRNAKSLIRRNMALIEQEHT